MRNACASMVDIKKGPQPVRECLQCKQIPVRDYDNFTYTIFDYFFNVSVPIQNRHLQVENVSHISDSFRFQVLKLTFYIVHG